MRPVEDDDILEIMGGDLKNAIKCLQASQMVVGSRIVALALMYLTKVKYRAKGEPYEFEAYNPETWKAVERTLNPPPPEKESFESVERILNPPPPEKESFESIKNSVKATIKKSIGELNGITVVEEEQNNE